MKKRLIVLFDYSENPGHLIRYASEWAAQEGAEIVIVHQNKAMVPAFADEQTRLQFLQSANEKELREIQKIANEIIPASQKVSFIISEHKLSTELAKLSEDSYDNIALVGLKKIGLLEKIFMGSTALEVIEKTENIVVALPGDIQHFTHEKIYVAVSPEQHFNVVEFNNLLKFIHPQETQITFFYLANPNEDTLVEERKIRELSEVFTDRFQVDYVIYEGKNTFRNIKEIINNKIDEILVVQKGSRLLTDQIFRKFLVHELVYEGNTPLIVLP